MDARDLTPEQLANLSKGITNQMLYFLKLRQRMDEQKWYTVDDVYQGVAAAEHLCRSLSLALKASAKRPKRIPSGTPGTAEFNGQPTILE